MFAHLLTADMGEKVWHPHQGRQQIIGQQRAHETRSESLHPAQQREQRLPVGLQPLARHLDQQTDVTLDHGVGRQGKTGYHAILIVLPHAIDGGDGAQPINSRHGQIEGLPAEHAPAAGQPVGRPRLRVRQPPVII